MLKQKHTQVFCFNSLHWLPYIVDKNELFYHLPQLGGSQKQKVEVQDIFIDRMMSRCPQYAKY